MIDYENELQIFVIQCDRCSNSEEYTEVDWHEGLEKAKEDGWKVRMFDGDWIHICPLHKISMR